MKTAINKGLIYINCVRTAIQHAKKTAALKSSEKDLQVSKLRTGYAPHKTIGVPTFLLRVLKASAVMMAPALPDAAEIPWAVAQKRVGNT